MSDWHKPQDKLPKVGCYYVVSLDDTFYMGKIIHVETFKDKFQNAVLEIGKGVMKRCTMNIWDYQLEVPALPKDENE